MRASGAVPAPASSWRRPAGADLANQPWYFPTKDPRLIPTANSPQLTVLIGRPRHGLDGDDKGGAGEWPEEGRSGRRERFGRGEVGVNGSTHREGLGTAVAMLRTWSDNHGLSVSPDGSGRLAPSCPIGLGHIGGYLRIFGRVSHALGVPKKRHRDGWDFGANFI